MRDGWRRVPLGEVASLDIAKVPVVPGTIYQIAGVLNAGKGMLKRDPIDGSETNYPALHRLRAGQLVMRKLTAWEGPITIVPKEYDGYVVSTEFPTFSLNVGELLPEFMRLICQQPGFWEKMRDASTGTVQRRKRVNPSQLLAIPLLLPPIHEQRRIADLMEAMERLITTADECALQGEEARTALLAAVLTPNEDEEWTSTSVGEITRLVKRGRAPLYADDGLVVMSQKCVRAGNRIDWTAARHTDHITRPVPEWALVQPGDTLVNSTGRGTLGRAAFIGFVPDEATVDSHVTIVRPDPEAVEPAFLGLALSTMQPVLESLQSGSTNQTELNRAAISALQLTLPSRQEQQRIVKLTASLDDTVHAARQMAASARTAQSALLTNLLSGTHEIPGAYDTLIKQAS